MKKVLQIPTADIALLYGALQDALADRAVLVPLSQGAAPLSAAELAQLRPETAVIIRTSGSSGYPKAVELSSAALLANAAAAHEALGGAGQWLVALPLEYMGGLGQVVRSIHSGIKPEFALDVDAATLLQRAAAMPHERRYLAVVPVQLQRLLRLAAADLAARETLAGLAAVLVGGGPVAVADRQLAWELGVNLVRTYGSTETAGGCVYDGVEIGDTLIRVRDGEVQLAGSNLALGYLGDPEATAAAFITDTAGTRWYRTGDSGNLLGGMLEITGRRDRVFISGGVNVALDRLTAVCEKMLPGSEVAAVAVADTQWGERAVLLQAAGAGSPENSMQHTELNAAIAAELGPAAKLLRIYTVSALPRLSNGKIDWVTATQLASQLLREEQVGAEGAQNAHE